MAAQKKAAVKKEDAVATTDDGAASEERRKAIQELITGDAELRQKHSLASQGICDEIEELIKETADFMNRFTIAAGNLIAEVCSTWEVEIEPDPHYSV